uniref:F-box domain-containing protein n=1 Tax=Lactuca sativa TaxID=4236 RepID=A0A9R1VMX4_LACSA|nr:hypothetical protein LSAT_V11C400165070 [Lactuca sativa]
MYFSYLYLGLKQALSLFLLMLCWIRIKWRKNLWIKSLREEMNVECKNSQDRISTLPQDTIEKILTHMPIRDAVRTSILSRKWRYSWTRMPKLVFDVNMYWNDMVVTSGNEELDTYISLSMPSSMFCCYARLRYWNSVSFQIDQIILHLSKDNNIKKFIFKIFGTDNYLRYPLPLMNKGFSRLKSLCFSEVDITTRCFFNSLPIAPSLRNLLGLENIQIQSLPSVIWLSFISVLKVSKLYIKDLGVGSNSMPHKLPISLPHLRILVLGVCFVDLSTVLCVISSSPNLEKIKVEMCQDHDCQCIRQTFNNLPDIQEDYSGINLDHLKELDITNFHNHGVEMEFVKLIMGKSPVLKKARIELHYRVSVNEEVKMLRGLVHMPLPRPSPAVSFTIERLFLETANKLSKNYSRYI